MCLRREFCSISDVRSREGEVINMSWNENEH